MNDTTEPYETIDAFRERSTEWIRANLPTSDDGTVDSHTLQQRLFDGGFAGIAFPAEYGGAGLTLEHQKVFADLCAALGRQMPTTYLVSIGMLGPTILDNASHEAKLRFLPPLLRGDEVWMQLLSEPRGGSDMAGSTTRLTRDGETYVLNGAKMWSTGAHVADYGLCLCRSDWDAPKHRGLSTIAVPLRGTPGVTIEQTRAANGLAGDFCQEFFDDVTLPVENLIGYENNGWAVARSLLLHERNAVANIGYGYGMSQRRPSSPGSSSSVDTSPTALADAARRRGVSNATGMLIADAYIEATVGPLTSSRIMTGLRTGSYVGQWGSLSKLQTAVASQRAARTALAVLGAESVIWDGVEIELDNPGTAWIGSRGDTIAGGTNEMQRNIVSERLLGLPREPTSDRDLPFNQVLRDLGYV